LLSDVSANHRCKKRSRKKIKNLKKRKNVIKIIKRLKTLNKNVSPNLFNLLPNAKGAI